MKKIFRLLMMAMMIALVTASMVTLNSCQTCTRQFGGTTNITLEKGQEFVNVTWKDNNIWVLTKNTATENYEFIEYSNIGVLEGKVIIHKPD